jgi:hypothetical protein
MTSSNSWVHCREWAGLIAAVALGPVFITLGYRGGWPTFLQSIPPPFPLGCPILAFFARVGGEATDATCVRSAQTRLLMSSWFPPFAKYAKDGAPSSYLLPAIKAGPPAEQDKFTDTITPYTNSSTITSTQTFNFGIQGQRLYPVRRIDRSLANSAYAPVSPPQFSIVIPALQQPTLNKQPSPHVGPCNGTYPPN